MQQLKFCLVLLFSLVITACNKAPAIQGTVQTVTGELIQLSDYRGQWIIINYWASWCEPCAKEIPELNAFYQAHAKRNAIVLGVNYDGLAPEKLAALVSQLGIQYPVLTADPKNIIGIEHVSGLPATYLISPQGQLVKTLYGEQTQQSLEEATALTA